MEEVAKKESWQFLIKKVCFYVLLILGFCAFCACIFFFLLPLVASFLPLASSKYDFVDGARKGHERLVFLKIAKIFAFTLFHAFFSSLLALFLGLVSAFFCANREFRGKRLFLSLSSIPLAVPSIIMALAYMLFFGNNGLFFVLIKKLFSVECNSFLYSSFGIVLIQGFYNFPLAMRFITESWRRVPKCELESALLLGAKPFFLFKTISLPHLMPAVLSSFLLIFLFCFFSFVIILLFSKVGTSTIEVELYKCISYSFDAPFAARLSLLEVCFASFLLVLHSYFKEKDRWGGFDEGWSFEKTKIKKGVESAIFIILVCIIGVFLIFPIFSILLYSFRGAQYSYDRLFSFSFKAWGNIFYSLTFWRACFNSIYVACGTMCISIFASLFFCYIKLFVFKKKIMDIIPFLPLVASSIMLGFGYSLILRRGSVFILILTQSSLFYLYIYSQMQLIIMNIPQSMIDSSLLLSKSRVLTYFNIVLPISYKGLFSGAIFVFAMSIADASLPYVLNIEGYLNLSLLLFHFISSYRLSEGAVLSIVLLFLSSLAFYIKELKTA